MGYFRKKPLVIEAIQFNGLNGSKISRFCPSAFTDGPMDTTATALVIPTLEGDMLVSVGDWIIKGIGGEFYPCKPDIFAATYEEVEGPDA